MRRCGAPRSGGRGFTLLEVALVLAIIGFLGLASMGLYTSYTLRAGLGQTLVNIGHIRTHVAVENASGRDPQLEAGAQPGKAPPRITSLADHHFNGPDGVTLWLARAPAGTFAAYPERSAYALAASVPDDSGMPRLRALHRIVQSERIWLSENSFLFPLVAVLPSGGASQPPGGGTEPPPEPPPPDGPCPPGWQQIGKANCRPPTPQPCPPGYEPIGKSGMCRANT